MSVLDARRGEAFVAAYSAAGEELLAPRAAAPEELPGLLPGTGPGCLAVGDGAVRFRAQLEGAGAVVPADGSPLHGVAARHLCRLAGEAKPAGRDAVLPDYVRLPDAELTRSRHQR